MVEEVEGRAATAYNDNAQYRDTVRNLILFDLIENSLTFEKDPVPL